MAGVIRFVCEWPENIVVEEGKKIMVPAFFSKLTCFNLLPHAELWGKVLTFDHQINKGYYVFLVKNRTKCHSLMAALVKLLHN